MQVTKVQEFHRGMIRAYAQKHGVDHRTVKRVLDGHDVKGLAGYRARLAAQELRRDHALLNGEADSIPQAVNG